MRIVEAGRAPRRHVLVELCRMLNQQYGELSAGEILRLAIDELAPHRFAVVSSFGAESVVLLKLLSEIDRTTPVLFLDTHKHFSETLEYRDELVAWLGLSNVRTFTPAASELRAGDPDGKLWEKDPDGCCALRKRAPLQRALAPFFVWANGRKRGQNVFRQDLQLFEAAPPHIKLNPLAHWTREDVASYMRRHGLPVHALVNEGFPSIGCAPCTHRVLVGEDERAGRWKGREKTECGIHNSPVVGGAR